MSVLGLLMLWSSSSLGSQLSALRLVARIFVCEVMPIKTW